MSDTIWLETFDGTSKSGGDQDNTMMLALAEPLDALADTLGTARLSTFYDNSALAEEYAGELGDAGVPAMQPTWFEARDGLQAVESLLTALRADPSRLKARLDRTRSHWPEQLVDELAYCHVALAEAAGQNQKFHFLVVA